MMKTPSFGLGCLIFLVAAPCAGADIGMVTLVDGRPKVLRGTAWFSLSEGVRVRDGDTLDVPDKGQLQLELALVRNVESVAVADAHAFGQTEPGRPAQNFRPPVDERDHPDVGAGTRRGDEKNQATEPERGSFHHRKPQASYQRGRQRRILGSRPLPSQREYCAIRSGKLG